jgi:hypothetical protein
MLFILRVKNPGSGIFLGISVLNSTLPLKRKMILIFLPEFSRISLLRSNDRERRSRPFSSRSPGLHLSGRPTFSPVDERHHSRHNDVARSVGVVVFGVAVEARRVAAVSSIVAVLQK